MSIIWWGGWQTWEYLTPLARGIKAIEKDLIWAKQCDSKEPSTVQIFFFFLVVIILHARHNVDGNIVLIWDLVGGIHSFESNYKKTREVTHMTGCWHYRGAHAVQQRSVFLLILKDYLCDNTLFEKYSSAEDKHATRVFF